MSARLSVIIPFCNEFPQVAFTVQSVLNEIRSLKDKAELIVVDNFCDEVEKQKTGDNFCPNCMTNFKNFRVRDKGGAFLQQQAKLLPQLKYIQYNNKLSHWNAKNVGVEAATGDILLFLDAHVVPSLGSIKAMFEYYTIYYKEINGTLHLPLAYLLASTGSELIYKLLTNPDKGYYHYTFSKYCREDGPYTTAVMSTCGMMISRELFDLLGGWPQELGIYGGGENFINFTLGILGRDKHIMATGPLYHYAEKRGYIWNYDDFLRNRTIAVHMFAGKEAAHKFIHNCRGNDDILEKIYQDVISKTAKHREYIKSIQQLDINEWLSKMKKEGLWDGKISNKQYLD